MPCTSQPRHDVPYDRPVDRNTRREARAAPGPPPVPETARWPADRPRCWQPAATPKRPRRHRPPAAPAPLPPPAPEPPDGRALLQGHRTVHRAREQSRSAPRRHAGVITPNELFFVRNNGGSLGIRETDWRLVIEGDAVEKGIRLSYEGIRSLPAQDADRLSRVRREPPGDVRPGPGAARRRNPVGYRRHRERGLARRPPRRRVGTGGDHRDRGVRPPDRARRGGAGGRFPAGAAGGEGPCRRAPRLRAQRRAAAAGPRVSVTGPGPRLGREFQHQVARPDRGLERAPLDPEQHEFLRPDRRQLSAGGPGNGPGRHGPDDQERPRPALAGGTRPRASHSPIRVG